MSTVSTSKNRTVVAAGWALASGAIHQFSQVAVSLALAALLGPEAFGVIALASMYVLLVEFLVRQGVVQAVIQRKDLGERHLDAAFWMTMGTGVGLCAFTLVFAGVWADFNHAPSLRPLLMALSGVGILQAFWQVPTAILQRDLDFRASEVPLNIGTVVGGMAGVTAALLGAEEWSIVVQLYTYGVIGTVLLYRATDWRPRMRFSLDAAKDLFNVSSGALLSSLGMFLGQRADSILLGVAFGPLALGLYRLGARFVQVIINITSSSLGRVVLAVLSRHQTDGEGYRRALRKQLRGLYLVVLPALGILLATGRGVALLFGDAWEPAGPTLRILCLAGMFAASIEFTTPILESLGRAHAAAGVLWLTACTNISVMTVAAVLLHDSDVQTQVVGVATARMATQMLLVTPATLLFLSRATKMPITGFVVPMIPPAFAAGAAVAAGLFVDQIAQRRDFGALFTIALVGTVATVAAGIALYLSSSEARFVVAKLRGRLRANRGGSILSTDSPGGPISR